MQLKLKFNRQSGFTLIEVLVAVIILAIGLLGLASLQVIGVGNNHSAYMRSQATSLAYEMADRLRANRQAARNDEYNALADFEATECDLAFAAVADVVENDIAEWRNNIACFLPDGEGRVERDGDVFTMTVRWIDSRDDDEGGTFIDPPFVVVTQI